VKKNYSWYHQTATPPYSLSSYTYSPQKLYEEHGGFHAIYKLQYTTSIDALLEIETQNRKKLFELVVTGRS
jgi:hypothetical protein